MIELDGLVKTYPDGLRALSGVSLRLEGGMYGLLGPNGAGKTTLLSLLVLSREPSAGRRLYDGLDAARPRHRAEIRAMLGYLPQEFSPLTELTGREYLRHCAQLRRVRLGRRALADRLDRLLDAVGLSAAADRRSGEYSGGMKRRLGVAQALVHAPRVLVVDEPTAGLDPEERVRFRNLVAAVARRTAVLLSTHIVEDVEATCPRLGVLAGGRLLFDGPPGELLRRVAGRLWRLPPGTGAPAGALEVARRAAAGGGDEAVVYAAQPPAGASPREPTLEDAYATFLALAATPEAA